MIFTTVLSTSTSNKIFIRHAYSIYVPEHLHLSQPYRLFLRPTLGKLGQFNAMAADRLAPCDAMSPATMILTALDVDIFYFLGTMNIDTE